MKFRLMAAIALAVLISISRANAADTPTADRITYDNQCFTINGKDILIYSGAFHYFRCPKPLWADRFAKMKAAGLNTVETYVAWNWHEPQPPADVNDFSKVDMTDLNDWLKMAIDQFGFNVILRPGPYICAEWDGGGYPQWLTTKKPAGFKGMWFRGDDPQYLAWCNHWYTAVAKVAVPWQITHQPPGKPGVILWQLENEYNYDNAHSAQAKLNQLVALGHDSRDLGIDVPLLTCVTEDALYRQNEFLRDNVWDTRNEYPKYGMSGFVNSLEGQGRYQPDKPRGISELQGGWFAQVTGRLSDQQGFNAEHIQHITLLAWAHGYVSTNYYMMFGGTNLGDWAASNIITSYDYAAPIRESGGTWDRYFAVASMGQFITDHGPDLARSAPEQVNVASRAADITPVLRRSAQGNHYLFLFNESQFTAHKGTLELSTNSPDSIHLQVNYDLKPFGSKILYLPAGTTDAAQGQWLPQPIAPPQRPTNLPAAIAINEFQRMADPGPTQWQKKSPGQGEEADGIYDRRYVYYQADLPSDAGSDKVLIVRPDLRDSLIASVNGQPLKTIRAGWGSTAFDLSGSPSGKLNLLYQNPGRGNGGEAMELPGGIQSLQLVDRASLPLAIGQWRVKIAADQPDADLAASVDDSQWPTLEAQGRDIRPGQTVIYRAHFDLTDQQIKSGITELAMPPSADAPAVYVNGQKVNLSAGQAESATADVAPQVHAGDNVLALVMVNRARRGGVLRGTQLQAKTGGGAAVDVASEISGEPTGIAQKWSDPQFDDSKWETISSGNPTVDPPSTAGLVWYRMKFDLPPQDPHVWLPWELKLNAKGDGFVYLNGHFIGRWWQNGPQQNYYLPDCWLNHGPSGRNMVALCLCPIGSASLVSAAVVPQADVAESR